MIRAALAAALLSITSVRAVETLIEVDGVGCHTRQLAIQKIWSALPGISSVIIIPRGPADAANRRTFVISSSQAPTREALEAALGNRIRFYKIRSVTTKDLPTPALSTQPAPATVRP